MSDRLQAALGREILSERGSNYRRNVLVIGALIIAVQLAGDGIDFSRVSFLGATFSSKLGHPRDWLLGILWGTLTYHLGTLGYYSDRDLAAWATDACWTGGSGTGARTAFPQLRMYLGCKPRDLKWAPVSLTSTGKISDWTFVRVGGTAQWKASFIDDVNNTQHVHRQMEISEAQYRLARSKLLYFYLLDIGLPLAVSAFALAVAMKTFISP